MIYSKAQEYKKTRILTASKGELIKMLYDGAINFLYSAIDAINEKRYDKANVLLIRVQRILTELMLGLDRKVGKLAENLFSLYDYMHYSLVNANINKDTNKIHEVIEMFKTLSEAWGQALEKEKAKAMSPYKNGGGGLDIKG